MAKDRIPLQVTPQRLWDLLQLKGGNVGLSFVPQVLPVIDIERQLLAPASLTPIESGVLNIVAVGFQGFTVPQSERWTVYHVGAVTDTLDADQVITLQTAIVYPSGSAYATDTSGVSLAPASGRSRGGVGFYPPGGVVVPPGFAIGVNVVGVTVGVAASVQLFVGVLRTVESSG